MPISFLHSAKSLVLLVGILLTISCLVPQLARADSFDIYGYPIEDFTTDQTLDVAPGYDATPEAAGGGSLPAAPRTVETPVTVVGDGENLILQYLHKFITNTFGWLVTVTGSLFDYSISSFTIGFGALYQSSNLGFTINNIWGTVRDIFNLTFIFGLIYIGFKLILDSSDSSARKMLVSLLGAALLVNFSLFITKFVVDFSNIAALKVYEAFQSVSGAEVSIGLAFMKLLGVSSIWNYPFNTEAGFAYIFGLMIVLAILTYVFLAGAILLTIRFVVLNIYMVFSPIMFLGWVFPSMAGQSRNYWSGFLGQAFFAPAFLFMIYLSYRVTQTFNAGLTKDFSRAFPSDGGGPGGIIGIETIVPFFAVVIVFLLASMMVAKKMGAVGAASTISIGDRMQKGMRGYIGGGAANAGRWTIDRMARNDGHDENAPNPTMRRAGRLLARTATTLGARAALESAAKPYTSVNKARSEAKAGLASRDSLARNEYAINAGLDALRTPEAARTPEQIAAVTEMQRIAPTLSIEQLENMSDSNRLAITPHLTSSQAEKVGESKELSSEQKKAFTAARIAAVERLVAGNVDEVAKLSLEQLELMGEPWVSNQISNGTIKQTQIDDLKKSKKYSEGQRNGFSSKFNTQQGDSVKAKVGLNPGGTFNSVNFGKLSTTELEKMSVAELSNHAHYITETQMDSLLKTSKKFNDDEKRDLEAFRKGNIGNPANLNQLFVHTDGTPRSPADIAKIPAGIIMGNLAGIIHHLSDPVLRELATKGKLSAVEQQQIEAMVARYPGSAHPTAAGYLGSNHAATNWG